MWHAYNLIQEVSGPDLPCCRWRRGSTATRGELTPVRIRRETGSEHQQSGTLPTPLSSRCQLTRFPSSRVQTESATGTMTSRRVHTTLTIAVTKVVYSALAINADPSASGQPGPEDLTTAPTTAAAHATSGSATLHVSGQVSEENQHVKKGAFHTLDLEVDRDFTIIKHAGEWDSVARERIRDMTEVGHGADVGAIVCGEGTLLGWDEGISLRRCLQHCIFRDGQHLPHHKPHDHHSATNRRSSSPETKRRNGPRS